jgi:hypothetical protein
MGALQDDWTVYRYSLIFRVGVAVLFWALGEPWNITVKHEMMGVLVLGVGMWFE